MAEVVANFIATREQEQKFDMDIVETDDTVNKDEVISVCSENTYDYDLDDDDDDEVFNQILAKNWIITNVENVDIETANITSDNNNNQNVVERDEASYF